MKVLDSITLQLIPSLSLIIKDYLQFDEKLKEFYSHPIHSIKDFEKVIKDKKNSIIQRETLTKIIRNQYHFADSSDAIFSQIDLLESENTFTVVAAHQPCLLMGPVFNIYKICSVINLCRQLKISFPDYQFVPVFWMGSEDHDFEELNHTYVFNKRLQIDEQFDGPIGRMPTSYIQHSLTEALALFPDNDFLKKLIQQNKAEHFAEWTQQFLHTLFGEFGLVVINQDDVRFKQVFKHIIQDEIEHQRAFHVLKKSNEQLVQNGYKLQVSPREINFFYISDTYRKRIVADDNGFNVLDTSISFSAKEMSNEIQGNPENFSPNVIFRPIMQELILPNIAFVGGSGELSYWLQLKPLFTHYNVSYPALIHRSAACVLTNTQMKRWSKLSFSLRDLFQDYHLLEKQFLQRNSSIDMSKFSDKLETVFQELIAEAGGIDASLKDSLQADKQRLLNLFSQTESKITKAAKRKEEDNLKQLKSFYESVFPDGSWQERRENFLTFYCKNVDTFIPFLIDHLDPLKQQFLFIEE